MSAGPSTEVRGDAPALTGEDQGREQLYGVLARLWYDAPDQALLDRLAGSEELFGDAAGGTLVESWRGLARAAAVADPAALKTEYDNTFVGVGKAAVTLYCSYYLTASGRERIVAALRDELRDLGLARMGGSHEPEDHLAVLCEVMRHLVLAGSGSYALDCQKSFFLRYIQPAYIRLTDEVRNAAAGQFYNEVARVMKAFFDVESESFQMV
jgi:TorA maturation chaperone TorD